MSSVGAATAQPAPDMHVPVYKEDLTPYPLLAGKFGSVDPAFSTSELELLARNFIALYGATAAADSFQN